MVVLVGGSENRGLLTFLHGALDYRPDVLTLFVQTALQLDEEFHPGLLDETSSSQHSVLNVLPGQVLSQLLLQSLNVQLTPAALLLLRFASISGGLRETMKNSSSKDSTGLMPGTMTSAFDLYMMRPYLGTNP